MSENQNKLPHIVDCLGTCKTPIGCTCGKRKPKGAEENIDSNICTCGKNPGGLCGCKTGEGCGCKSTKSDSGASGCAGCTKTKKCCGTNKLEVYDWLADLPESQTESQMIEVQFKNTRKGYYLNSNGLDLYKGDIVAVEATPGHDIGEVTLTGKLVILQMKKNNYRTLNGEHKRVYRLAKPSDLEKYEEAKAKEHKTMLRSREIAEELQLAMKISDVEYQGDGNKAIFYYIADERVDFRQLIKVYAEQFRVKIEMKQIGARQEAGRVGGIGPCGRELCCSSSISSFVSVSTAAARYQDISLNPQKLAGQCGKLKCCLNYEVDTYVEAQKKLPSKEVVLETKDASFFHFKTDILSGMMTYSSDKRFAANLVTVDKERVYEIIRMNRNGKKPLKIDVKEPQVEEKSTYGDVLEQESITRFDSTGGGNNRRNKNRKVVKNQQNNDRSKPDGQQQPKKVFTPRSNDQNKEVKEGSERPEGNAAPNLNRNNRNRKFRKNNNNSRNGNNKDSQGATPSPQ